LPPKKPAPAELPELSTARLRLAHARPTMARSFAEFMVRNETHLQRWDPPRPAGVGTVAHWRRQLATAVREFRAGSALRWVLLDAASGAAHDARAPLVGRITFTQIFRGPFQSCVLGYQLDASAEGKGLMFEALRAALDDIFLIRGLHRVQAAFMLENERSAKLLDRLGFERIGVARGYLFINGAWRDHMLAALINPNFDDTRFSG
jgi:ribosomal-protein-alanine N-acetyltransferase